jgi:hypothetical protein
VFNFSFFLSVQAAMSSLIPWTPTTVGAAHRLTTTNAAAALRLAFSAVHELAKYVIGTIKDLNGQQSDTTRFKKKIEELQQKLGDRDRRTEQLESQLRAITARVEALEEKEEHAKASEERGEKAPVEIPLEAICSAGFEDLYCDPQGLYDSGIEEPSVLGRRWVDDQQPDLIPWTSQKLELHQPTFAIQYSLENSGQPNTSALKRKRPDSDTEHEESSDEVFPSKHKKGHVRQGKCLFLTLETLSQQEGTPDCAKLAAKTLKQLRSEIKAEEVGALTKEQENQLGQKKKPLAAYSQKYIDLFNELRDSKHWAHVQSAYKEIKSKQVKKAKAFQTNKKPRTKASKPLDSKLYV